MEIKDELIQAQEEYIKLLGGITRNKTHFHVNGRKTDPALIKKEGELRTKIKELKSKI